MRDQLNAQKVHIIPEPSSMETRAGQFKLPKQITLSVSPDFALIGKEITERIKTTTGKKVVIGQQKNATIKIENVNPCTKLLDK